MPDAGDIVVADYPGAMGLKRRPAVVLSSSTYHATRPDVILGLITSQTTSAVGAPDWPAQNYRLQAQNHGDGLCRVLFRAASLRQALVVLHIRCRQPRPLPARLAGEEVWRAKVRRWATVCDPCQLAVCEEVCRAVTS